MVFNVKDALIGYKYKFENQNYFGFYILAKYQYFLENK